MMASATPKNELSSSPQDSPSGPMPPETLKKMIEDIKARAAAEQHAPRRYEKILPSQRIDLSGRPGFATSGDLPYTKNGGGPLRIISRNGELTELGKKLERERSAESAAAAVATSDDGNKENPTAGSAEERSS
jgi:hypothetical protein